MPSGNDRLRNLSAFAACLGEVMWERKRTETVAAAYRKLATLPSKSTMVIDGIDFGPTYRFARERARQRNIELWRLVFGFDAAKGKLAKLVSVPTEVLMRDDLSNQGKPMVSWFGE